MTQKQEWERFMTQKIVNTEGTTPESIVPPK